MTPNPQSVCKHCGKLERNHFTNHKFCNSDLRGIDIKSKKYFEPSEPASLNAPAGTNPCRYRIGQTVFWNGQLGECSGKIIDITRPENSDYVLLLDIGDGAEMFHSVRDVWMAPAPAEHQGVQQPRTLICSRCHAEVRCDGEFKLWKHSNGGLMCEDAEAVETAPQPVAGEGAQWTMKPASRDLTSIMSYPADYFITRSDGMTLYLSNDELEQLAKGHLQLAPLQELPPEVTPKLEEGIVAATEEIWDLLYGTEKYDQWDIGSIIRKHLRPFITPASTSPEAVQTATGIYLPLDRYNNTMEAILRFGMHDIGCNPGFRNAEEEKQNCICGFAKAKEDAGTEPWYQNFMVAVEKKLHSDNQRDKNHKSLLLYAAELNKDLAEIAELAGVNKGIFTKDELIDAVRKLAAPATPTESVREGPRCANAACKHLQQTHSKWACEQAGCKCLEFEASSPSVPLLDVDGQEFKDLVGRVKSTIKHDLDPDGSLDSQAETMAEFCRKEILARGRE